MEMYVKAVYLVSRDSGEPAKTGEISAELGVSPPSVTEMLDRLQDLGLLEHEKYRGAELTERGHDVAVKVLRKHCLLERFLLEALDVKDDFHDQACRLEHVLEDETALRLTRLVDLPKECPGCYDMEMHHCSKLPI